MAWGLEQIRRNPNVEQRLVDSKHAWDDGLDFVRVDRSERACDGVHILGWSPDAEASQ
jgi:hypothetical protein